MSNVAQGGAAIAAFFIIKHIKLKGVASAAGISALLGITEPAMFGVNLKLRYPFIGAVVGSGLGSAYISFFKVKAIALGTAGLPGFISINPAHAGWLHYLRYDDCLYCVNRCYICFIERKTYKAAEAIKSPALNLKSNSSGTFI